jgi:glycerophosphoryl diester phosphodiesterase
MPELIRVGHRGAAALAPGNTLAGFDAALALGVDMIEFDVLASRNGGDGELYVAHDFGALDLTRPLTLDAALEHMSSPAYRGIRLQLDIKRRGIEQRVLAALKRAEALERAFISTSDGSVLERLRAIAPELELGWTVPTIPGVTGTPLITPTLGRIYRRLLPERAASKLRAGAIDALVPHWSLVDRELVDAVRRAGGEIYVWTVDDRAEIERLAALRVTGVITNDPRLFG